RRRRGARAFALPDDSDRGEEARAVRVLGSDGENRNDARKNPEDRGKAPGSEARDVSRSASRLRFHRGQLCPPPCRQQDGGGPKQEEGMIRRFEDRAAGSNPQEQRGVRMADERFVQIAPLMRDPGIVEIKTPQKARASTNGAKICGIDVGSTTCKYTLASADGEVISQAYERHNTKQAEKVLQFLSRLEAQHGLTPQHDRVFFTGSGAGLIAPLAGGKIIQEVVAVAASVERLHPSVRFVSEIGGKDMKTIFFNGNEKTKSKQVLMQSACSGGTGSFIEKTARKLQIPPEQLSDMHYTGHTLHKISSKCGIFAEADANTLLKAGVTVDEIIASLFEAVVYQNLATLTRGNTPSPEVLLLGGPNLFFKGLQEAWRLHLTHIWKERKIQMPEGRDPESLINVPQDALYYAALGCIEVGLGEAPSVGIYQGMKKLLWWIEEGQYEEKKKQGRGGLCDSEDNLRTFIDLYSKMDKTANGNGH